MKRTLSGLLDGLVTELPSVGTAGSRSSLLHAEPAHDGQGDIRYDTALPNQGRARVTISQLRTFFILRWMGTVGSLLIAVGALGAGALPVVTNPYDNVPLGSLMSRMLQSSSALVFTGVGLLALAWVLLAPYVGTPLRGEQFNAVTNLEIRSKHGSAKARRTKGGSPEEPVPAARPTRVAATPRLVSVAQLWRTYACWIIPLIVTAPLFTQDIYSYLAQGSSVAQGMDPYSAGPVELLGSDDILARSVPFIWANSPSPYGPVALGLAAGISRLTSDSILLGVLSHRILSVLGMAAAGWAITRLARRCNVSPESALWLGVLNPLAILHLIGGIHNESILLGFALAGMELGLRGLDWMDQRPGFRAWMLVVASGALISAAGMVKVTGFIGLGFIGMALARFLHDKRKLAAWKAILYAAAGQALLLIGSVIAITLLTGIGLGWITSQGGAATIRSWLSLSTDSGVFAGFLGMLLGLGDHTESMLTITRAAGVLVAAAFMVRMLFATFKGTIHPVGGLGVSTLVLVIFFPVVHPWYLLWAVLPLSAWANRLIFRLTVVAYSTVMSFVVLPRGLGLPPGTIFTIYAAAALTFAIVAAIWWVLLRRSGARILN
ncbi:polyprenol phosphomannose-dependent alpha 1,6 mannosyltransferase MptB [Corynebacterium endometrii]|uniref:Alpha 1,6 mannopyranosyltransferase n=1 Tax=Corynebacterium endometrii TaxID=2488819 RepID=A0A4P7QFK9_9CORY|nr:polyprenol phosphomannose-dependent alpha 1,6 mannosyltransferase MptB [Corynebacterium endometrii]QCB28475.1 hypothetical protein CENDO_05980 [Corynebacterium endometrii]